MPYTGTGAYMQPHNALQYRDGVCIHICGNKFAIESEHRMVVDMGVFFQDLSWISFLIQ